MTGKEGERRKGERGREREQNDTEATESIQLKYTR